MVRPYIIDDEDLFILYGEMMRVSIDFRVASTEIVSINGTTVEGHTLN